MVCLGSDDLSEGSHDSVFGNEFGMRGTALQSHVHNKIDPTDQKNPSFVCLKLSPISQ